MSAIRERLREAARAAWTGPEAETLRASLASQAHGSGFAKCLEGLMKEGRAGKSSYAKCAIDKNLKTAYKSAWGKPG